MTWRVEAEETVSESISYSHFASGVRVWLERPQVINRRLLGSVFVHQTALSTSFISVDPSMVTKNEGIDVRTQEYCDQISSALLSGEGSNGQKLIVRKLLPRMRGMAERLEAVIINDSDHTVTFCPLNETSHSPPNIPIGTYQIQLLSGVNPRIVLSTWSAVPTPSSTRDKAILTINGITTPTLEWLKTVLLPKVSQWTKESWLQPQAVKGKSLIPLSRYSQLYSELKRKYGESLVKNWPEATDPHKFVYEDIAIATYLLVLWEEERTESGLDRRQSFVDLGCGNGLLVYLLCAEGHPGKGIDLRERKIWKMFRDTAMLEISTLTPSDSTLFPDYDWLLGNHSDELTPWIPVMAGQSSYQSKYFVLPCCPHDFESRYRRRGSDKSQYRSYLDYVREIGESMGFKVQEDTLRIPSSKRVCQIGRYRSYLISDEAVMDKKRMAFLDQRCPSRTVGGAIQTLTSMKTQTEETRTSERVLEDSNICMPPSNNLQPSTDSDGQPEVSNSQSEVSSALITGHKWATGFKPRSLTEHMRNCSLIGYDVRALMVQRLTNVLLTTENYVEVKCLQSCRGEVVSVDRLRWNLGGKLPLREAVHLLDFDLRKKLKKEFGGLQTLLRNEHQVFEVYRGEVQLRNWSLYQQHMVKRSKNPVRSKRDAILLRKTKPCWFYTHHPQGCPRLDKDCPYAHGEHELQQRPDFTVL